MNDVPASLNIATVEALASARGIDSYAELARMVGVDRTYLSRILRGDRPAQPSLVLDLARVLMVKPIVLLGPVDAVLAVEALEQAATRASVPA